MLFKTIPANGETCCACCGRFHRKLFLVDGRWVGRACAEQIELYDRFPSPESVVWIGYEKQYAKVKNFKNAG